MLSAVISSVLSYPAMPLARQPIHQRCVLSGPLVLGKSPLKFRTPTADRDRTVSRRSKPSSRTTLNRRTAIPLGPAPAPGCDEPTSRCQTAPSIWNSWVRSACYPRRTFYPLSDDPSTRDHRITMTDFRLCLARRPCSQAGFCHCTQQPISDRSEPTIARLRYSLGGDRPSQTAHHAWSRTPFRGRG